MKLFFKLSILCLLGISLTSKADPSVVVSNEKSIFLGIKKPITIQILGDNVFSITTTKGLNKTIVFESTNLIIYGKNIASINCLDSDVEKQWCEKYVAETLDTISKISPKITYDSEKAIVGQVQGRLGKFIADLNSRRLERKLQESKPTFSEVNVKVGVEVQSAK